MNKKTKQLIIWGVTVVIAVALIWSISIISRTSQEPQTALQEFAQCLDEQGAKFYGAFWCPHCQDQEEMFGDAAEFLPYVECSTPDGRGQLDVCRQAEVDAYPTWDFADGTRLGGVQQFAALAEKTGCELPGQ